MSTQEATPRRCQGTGSIIIRRNAAGHDVYFGQWTPPGGKQLKRRLGFKRSPDHPGGLTRRQAEALLRRLIAETKATATVGEKLTIAEVGERYVTHLERLGRKRSTISAVRMTLDVHLAPYFAGRSLAAITHTDVHDLIAVMEGKGLAPKSIHNYVGVLSAVFAFASSPRRRWASGNPCRDAELPAVPSSTEIRWLDIDELDALVNAASGEFQAIDRALFRTAAMTGLRMGELLALRWQDVDWIAARIRVSRSWVMGEYTTPKSRRSVRSVPLADEVGGELERLFKASGEPGEDGLVFANPLSGEPLDKSALRRRYRKALKAAGLDTSHRFHDLRHTFGTQMAAAGMPMRTLQELMGHRDIATTQRYADYAPNAREAELVAAAFARAENGRVNGSPVTRAAGDDEDDA
jgi:integrase